MTDIKRKSNSNSICKNYEYDESGMGKFYGACCVTCINSHTKKCPKESKKKRSRK